MVDVELMVVADVIEDFDVDNEILDVDVWIVDFVVLYVDVEKVVL